MRVLCHDYEANSAVYFVDDVSMTITVLSIPDPPTNVTATSTTPGHATVSWTPPGDATSDQVSGYTVTTFDDQRNQFGAPVTVGSSPATITGLTNGTPYYFSVASVNVVGTGAAAYSYSVTPSSGTAPPPRSTAVSTAQYYLPNSDGATWQSLDETNLSLTITPVSTEDVLLSANADLWTWNAGFNQDIGITVNGTLVAWKESGGFAGTFSPNAAFVETVYHMTAATTYSVEVVWKTNTAALGRSVSAGAGGPSAPFSPTRLSAKVLTAGQFQTAVSTQQYNLPNSNGATWVAVDGTNLSTTLAPSSNEDVLLSGNADLWTWNAGYNQDIGIAVSDNGGPQVVVAWKESGGFAGTFSPNAAFVQTVFHAQATHSYTVQLVWKTNKPASGAQITIGAGGSSPFSPTRLTQWVLPTDPTLWGSGVSTTQYTLSNSDGSTWTEMDPSNEVVTVTPSGGENTLVSGNADLWTSNAGYNQDIAIYVTVDGGAQQLLAWKESGGFGGTFSPNAAFVQTYYPMASGHTYVFSLWWKANKPASGATIWAGAGISGQYSPTRLTVAPA
jgi:Fibronectin type III domain